MATRLARLKPQAIQGGMNNASSTKIFPHQHLRILQSQQVRRQQGKPLTATTTTTTLLPATTEPTKLSHDDVVQQPNRAIEIATNAADPNTMKKDGPRNPLTETDKQPRVCNNQGSWFPQTPPRVTSGHFYLPSKSPIIKNQRRHNED